MVMQILPKEAAIVDKVASFVSNRVQPHSRAWERDQAFPATIWAELAELGLLGMCLPRDWGGQELSCLAFCEICRELAKGDPALAMNVAAINALAIGHIFKYGTKEQKEKYLPGIVSGRIKLAWALTEPEAGSDARRVQTQAEPDPTQHGYFRLNGEKKFITNGGNADLIVVIARTNPKDLSAFLLETTDPGFQLTERIHTVGVSASNTVAFRLENAQAWHTPCTFDEAISLLYRGRLGIAAMAVGIAEKAFELTVEYSKQREQFNRRLADMQSVQNMIADSAVEIEAARLLMRQGASLEDQGKDIILASAMAKLYASETANRVTNRAIQIHGGRGLTYDYLVEKLWRDAKLTEIGEGCSEIQRLVISKQVLR